MVTHVQLAQKVAYNVTIQIVSFVKKALLYPQTLVETRYVNLAMITVLLAIQIFAMNVNQDLKLME